MGIVADMRRDAKRLRSLVAARPVAARPESRYAGRPIDYSREHLKLVLTPQQERILTLLDTPPYRVLVRSANNQGKTFVAAVRCSYAYDSFDPGIVLATAPTRVQVRDLLFKELRTLRPTAHGFLPKDTRLESSPTHFVHGFTAATADGFQGRHDGHLGIVFDEATGVDFEFWKRGETMFNGVPGHWWLSTYNPNDPSSPAFAAEESGLWHLVELNALEHPNIAAELRGEEPPIPSAVRLATVRRRIAGECVEVAEKDFDPASDFEFGGKLYRPQSAAFEAAILGRWPIAAADSIWSPTEVDRLYGRALGIDWTWPIQIGCDVARFGDDNTCIAVRVGPCLVHLEVLSHRRTGEIAGKIRELAAAANGGSEQGGRSVRILIDETGGWGCGVVDALAGWNVTGVNAAAKSPDERFPNVRSYLWYYAKQMAEVMDFSRIEKGEFDALKLELTAPRYHLDAKNRRVVEIKTQVKKRLGRSPDRADAVNLCYYLGA